MGFKKDERYNENIILIPISTEYGIGARCLDLLGSKELLCWTIDEALNSQRTSSVIVIAPMKPLYHLFEYLSEHG